MDTHSITLDADPGAKEQYATRTRPAGMQFQIIGPLRDIETIAVGHGIRDLAHLKQPYGAGRWRKLKGVATVVLESGAVRVAELHWYEASGIGKRRIKIKRYLDR